MQPKTSKKANKNFSQRGNSRKQSKNLGPAGVNMMPRGPAPRVSSLPASYLTSTLDPTWLRMSGRVTHPELGGGVRIVGRQLVAQVTTTASDLQIFSSADSPATVGTNSFNLSPDSLNGRLALQARTYDRYCFRKAVLTYISRVPTTQAGSFALGYVGDVTIPYSAYASISSMSPSMNSPFISPVSRLTIVDDMSTTKTWYTQLDLTSTASKRLTIQGTVVGGPDVSSIGAVTMGWLWLDYMIDLYQPTQDEGFSIRLSPEEREEVLSRRREASAPPSREQEIVQLQLRLQQLKGNFNL